MSNQVFVNLAYEGGTYELLLNNEDTFGSMKQKIKSLLLDKLSINIDEGDVSIRLGFPPKTIEGEVWDPISIQDLGISNNEQIRLNLLKEPIKEAIKESPSKVDNTKPPHLLSRQVIPADNSCLFNAINYAMNNVIDQPEIMRELIAVEIVSNPDLYSQAILDKEPSEYCEWIMQNDTWGGGIELSILSKCFQVRLAVVDINNLAIEYFGEDYSNIIYLLYDGVHYDVLVKKGDK
jgi:ubiquitin thioesterase OTU1